MNPTNPPPSAQPPKHCLGTTAQGRPCRARPTKGSLYCHAHSSQADAELDAQALDPPQPVRDVDTIDDLIHDMRDKLARLSEMIDRADDGDQSLKYLAIYGRNATYLARLLLEKRMLPAEPAMDIMDVIGLALDEISEELGIEL